MSKVLVTHSYFMRFDPKQWGLQQSFAPLGTLYAASALRKEGHDVAFFDVMFSESAEEIFPILEREQPEILLICDDGFNYLTKMCLTNMREAAFRMSRLGGEHGCKVIVSSSDATDHVESYLSQGAHYIIHGETEATLVSLVNQLSSGNNHFPELAGISYNYEGAIQSTATPEPISNLDTLPFPAWDLVDMKRYRSMWLHRYGYFSINLATTRGCPFRCTWCAKPIYGYRYNSHSPKYIIDQLLELKKIIGFEKVWFCDDIFGLDKRWLTEFSRLVTENKLHFRYKIQSRADLLLDEEYVKNLARSGCEMVWLGTESGSQKVLDAMNKGIRIEQVEQATLMLRKYGIQPAFFIQFGYPGETIEDIRLTQRMINRLLPEDIGISVSYPLPGTLFYESVKNDLKEKSNWTDSDELALMFKNTYPPLFYKRLHRYIHKNYRLHQGWDQFKKTLKHPLHVQAKSLRRIVLIIYYIPTSIIAKIRLNHSIHE